jgi:hypothetical protein
MIRAAASIDSSVNNLSAIRASPINHLDLIAIVSVLAILSSCGGGSTTSVNTQPPGTDITVTFSGSAPLAVAEQIGTGAWTLVALPSNGRLTINVPSGTTNFAFAYACAIGQGIGLGSSSNDEIIVEAAVSDGTTYTGACISTVTPGVATGSADGSAIPGATNLYIYGGLIPGQPLGSVSGPFSLTLEAGTRDIAVVAEDASNNVLGVKIVRAQTVPGVLNNGNSITLASTDVTSSQSVAVTNVPSGFTPIVLAEYRTANGTTFGLNGLSSTQYAVVPSTEAQSGDSYLFSASAEGPVSGQVVAAALTASSPGAISLPMPAPMPYTPPTPTAFPTLTLNYNGFSGATDLKDSAQIFWSTGSNFYRIFVSATAAYVNGATTLAVPNLSSLAGFVSPASSGDLVDWLATVSAGSATTGAAAFATNFGRYTEP